MRLGEIEILPAELARRLAPVAGFRNVLAHQYTGIDWDSVYARMQDLSDLQAFRELVSAYLARRM